MGMLLWIGECGDSVCKVKVSRTCYYLIKVSRDLIPSQYGPCYGSNQGEI